MWLVWKPRDSLCSLCPEEGQTVRVRDKPRERQREREKNREGETGRERDGETQRQIERDRETQTERSRLVGGRMAYRSGQLCPGLCTDWCLRWPPPGSA